MNNGKQLLKNISVSLDSDISERLSYHNHLVLSSASLYTVGICIHIIFSQVHSPYPQFIPDGLSHWCIQGMTHAFPI